MEKNFKNWELDEMKQQMDLLKSKLDHQKIINDQLVRRTMSEKAGKLRKDLFVNRLTIREYSRWSLSTFRLFG